MKSTSEHSLHAFKRLFEDTTPEQSAPLAEDTKRLSASYLCDYVLSSLHSKDEFRDAVVESLYNPATESVLFALNPEFKMVKELIEFIQSLEMVEAVATGKRKNPKNDLDINAIKVKGNGKDCRTGTPPVTAIAKGTLRTGF